MTILETKLQFWVKKAILCQICNFESKRPFLRQTYNLESKEPFLRQSWIFLSKWPFLWQTCNFESNCPFMRQSCFFESKRTFLIMTISVKSIFMIHLFKKFPEFKISSNSKLGKNTGILQNSDNCGYPFTWD